jgi:hypothetical protein
MAPSAMHKHVSHKLIESEIAGTGIVKSQKVNQIDVVFGQSEGGKKK